MPFTAAEKLSYVERQMPRATSEREYALMEAIAADYRALDEAQGLPLEPPRSMSDQICPRCRMRYLPAKGACACETHQAVI